MKFSKLMALVAITAAFVLTQSVQVRAQEGDQAAAPAENGQAPGPASVDGQPPPEGQPNGEQQPQLHKKPKHNLIAKLDNSEKFEKKKKKKKKKKSAG